MLCLLEGFKIRVPASIAATYDAMQCVLTCRNYVVLAISIAAFLAVLQISLLLMLFWVRVGFQVLLVGHGIYFSGLWPALIPDKLLWFSTALEMLLISSTQFFLTLLFSALIGIYTSLTIFYRRRCSVSGRRDVSVGIAGFGIGGVASLITSTIVTIGCCGAFTSEIRPLIGGIATPLLALGLNIFGHILSELFRIAGIVILIIAIFWIGNKISSKSAS